PRPRAPAAPGRRLDEPRGPAARLRGGPDAPRLADGRLVRLLGPHALDRRAHPRSGRRARRVLHRRQEPDRRQARPVRGARRRRRALRAPQSRPGAGPADLHLQDGGGPRPRPPAAPAASRPRDRVPRRLGVRSDARERVPDGVGIQDATAGRHHGRARRVRRRVSRRGRLARRRPPRVHRGGRDGVPQRVGGCHRGESERALRHALRPAVERQAGARPRIRPGGADAERTPSLDAVVPRNVAIVGTGLMGASVGLAAKRAGAARVHGWDPDADALAAAVERGAVDVAAETLTAALGEAELAVVAAPVTLLPGLVEEVLAHAPESCTVTDVGSTKDWSLRFPGRFVGGHPVCGREARGAAYAAADLFDGATWFLTPVTGTDPDRYRLVHGFVASLGALPVAIDPRAHDRLVALTSHLPHALANLLVNQAGAGRIEGHDPLLAAGGSLRDMTRVAGANPRIWVDIFLDNGPELVEALAEHRRRVEQLESALAERDAGRLARWIAEAAENRRRMLADAYPDP